MQLISRRSFISAAIAAIGISLAPASFGAEPIKIGLVTALSIKRYMETVRPESKTDHLFVTERSINLPAGRPMTTDSLYCMVKRLGRKVGLGHVYVHLLRHTFGTMHATNGTSIFHLRKAMGHAKLTTTERYVHLAESKLPIASLVDNVSRPLRRGRTS